MWNKFLDWSRTNDTQIRWFFIGVFTVLFFHDAAAGEWLSAMVDLLFIGLNLWWVHPQDK